MIRAQYRKAKFRVKLLIIIASAAAVIMAISPIVSTMFTIKLIGYVTALITGVVQ